MDPVEHSVNTDQLEAVNRAFSKQSHLYDKEDEANPILKDMRQQVYNHLSRYLKPNSSILELNAGTGIDALHFISQGHRVYATDLSTGMIQQIQHKISKHQLYNQLFCEQISYSDLNTIKGQKFDYVFSNFGGLNCIEDLKKVTTHLPALLNNGGYVTFVIMPPVYLWEMLWVLKGDIRKAFRRFHKDGVMAHLEGEYFKTYYHSLSKIKESFPLSFEFIETEGLCSLTPPPSHTNFLSKNPGLYKALRRVDAMVQSTFPFNRWADHIIVTFKMIS